MIAARQRKRGLFGQGDDSAVIDAGGPSPTTAMQPAGLPMPQGPGGVDYQANPQAMIQAQDARAASMTPEQQVLGQRRPSPIAMRGEWENSFPTMQQQPAAMAPKKPGWMHGGKLGVGDAIGIALMVLGGNGAAAGQVMDRRRQNIERDRIASALRNQGYNDDQVTLATIDPESLGKNYNEQFGTRVVAPGSSVIGATPYGQRPQYRQPTDGEQYADAQGLDPSSPDYATALQAFALRGNGPTAFGFDRQLDDTRTANDIRLEGERQSGRLGLEGLRQQNRMGLEGTRQGNRIATRGTPTYRDLNPPAPRVGAGVRPRAASRIAVNPKTGEKMQLTNDNRWVPVK
jgi:hypothetical protein